MLYLQDLGIYQSIRFAADSYRESLFSPQFLLALQRHTFNEFHHTFIKFGHTKVYKFHCNITFLDKNKITAPHHRTTPPHHSKINTNRVCESRRAYNSYQEARTGGRFWLNNHTIEKLAHPSACGTRLCPWRLISKEKVSTCDIKEQTWERDAFERI